MRAAFESKLDLLRSSPDAEDREVQNALPSLLESEDPEETALLYEAAGRVRNDALGSRMAVRALIETSSYCRNDCLYCGLNRHNAKAERYRLAPEETVACAKKAYAHGIRTAVLQSGEDGAPAEETAETIREIKKIGDIAVTLSLGERPRSDFELWREAGADRYLMRIETSDPDLYAAIHRTRKLQSRLDCLSALQELGYQTGSGIMIGFPGQTIDHIARDILFFARSNFEMIGIGPFIPHPDTPLAGTSRGKPALVLNAIALVRLLMPTVWMPATTALGSLERDWRPDAIRAGANVLMPNFSPRETRARYAIYPGKRCIGEQASLVRSECEEIARAGNLQVDWSRADAPASGRRSGLGKCTSGSYTLNSFLSEAWRTIR